MSLHSEIHQQPTVPRNCEARPPGPSRRFLAVAVALVLLVAVLVLGCKTRDRGAASVPIPAAAEGAGAEAPPGEVKRQSGLDVLLITIDTLRTDAVGAYGRVGADTSWMDRLAAEGVRFDGAHAHNVLTLPSHANILSGLFPQEHGVRDNSGFRFPDGIATLASVLREQGYRTGAFVSAFPLDSRFGLDRGFDIYEDSFADAASRPAFFEQERSGSETVELARKWFFAEGSRPSFAWVHLYEPHFPYDPPEPWASRFRSDPYQGDVAAADAALGPLLGPIFAAEDNGSQPLVVLTSDHGESLGEHGEATHGIFAYESVLEVPLIFYQPELFAPRAVRAPARHVDLMPTILDALALPLPDGLQGRSLLGDAVGEPSSETVSTYFEALSGQLNRGWAPLYGVIDRGWKYLELPIPELYDLEEDPAEVANLAGVRPERVAQARAELAPLLAIDPGAAPDPESAEVRERLAALGYLGSTNPPASRTYTEADDPKNLIGLDEMLREVVTLRQTGDLAGALRLGRDLVRRRPGMRIVLLAVAELERESGNLTEGVRALSSALALRPDDASTLALLASYLTQAGREAEAVDVTDSHARLAEPDIEVLLTRGLALAKLRRPSEALEMFRKAEALDPDNPKVSVYLGTFYLMGGRRELARSAYARALKLNPDVASAHSSLAIMAVEEGRVEESLAHWRRALGSDPHEHGKLLAIGQGLWTAGRHDEARPMLELFAASAPVSAYSGEIAQVRRQLAQPG